MVNFALCLTNLALLHEGIRRSGHIDPHFLDLGTIRRWEVSFTPRPLYPRENSPQYPFEVGWTPELVWTTWIENSWPYRDSVVQSVISICTNWTITSNTINVWGSVKNSTVPPPPKRQYAIPAFQPMTPMQPYCRNMFHYLNTPLAKRKAAVKLSWNSISG
jgi:hypothetical protein